jgi:hypothetical protein
MDGDLKHPEYVVECKVKNSSKGVSIPAKELTKLQAEAKKQFKEWLFVVENESGNISITMDITLFSEMLATIEDHDNEQES